MPKPPPRETTSPSSLRSARARRFALAAQPALWLSALTLALVGAPRVAQADSWALLIGIDQYDDTNHITSLGGAAADARALAKTLEEVGGVPAEHIKVLVSGGQLPPTKGNILEALTRLKANAKPGDTVFVVYSGHGIEINGVPYLLPFDTKATSDDDIVDTALETAKFTQRLREIKAQALVMAFDMCRSDPRKEKRDVGGSDNKLTKSQVRGLDFTQASQTGGGSGAAVANAPISVTLYSCSPDERSYEDRLASRGFFSEYLEKGLRGAAADSNGAVRVSSLVKYLTATVHTAVEQAESASQTPYPETKGPNVDDFVLVHTASPAPVVPVAPVPPVVSAVDTAAHLTVTVNAANATVLLDGQAITPGQETSIDLGLDKTRVVEVGVKANGYQTKVQNVTLTRGSRLPLDVVLTAVAIPSPVANTLGDHGTEWITYVRRLLIELKVQAGTWPLSDIASTQAQFGDLAGAMQTAASITDAYLKAEAFANIASVQAQSGDTTGALQTLETAKQAAASISDAIEKVRELSLIANAQAQSGDRNGAVQTIENAKQTAENISARTLVTVSATGAKASALSRIATAQAQLGDLSGTRKTMASAKEIAASITDAYDKASTLSNIASDQAESGDIVGALSTAQDIANESSKGHALAAIASAQAQSGDVIGAKQTAESIASLFYKTFALSRIGSAQAQSGDRSGALQTVEDAKRTAESITQASQKVNALGAVASAEARCGDLAGARQLADSITRANLKSSTLSAVALAQVRSDDITGAIQTWASAKQIAEGAKDAFERDYTLSQIAEDLAKSIQKAK